MIPLKPVLFGDLAVGGRFIEATTPNTLVKTTESNASVADYHSAPVHNEPSRPVIDLPSPSLNVTMERRLGRDKVYGLISADPCASWLRIRHRAGGACLVEMPFEGF